MERSAKRMVVKTGESAIGFEAHPDVPSDVLTRVGRPAAHQNSDLSECAFLVARRNRGRIALDARSVPVFCDSVFGRLR